MLNEIELLDLRLHELYDAVDYFVIVEANKTFSYQDKPLHYQRHADRWKSMWDKIIYVPITDMPHDLQRWKAEYHQRNAIMRGLNGAKDNDIIVISDLDEIWDKNKFKTDGLPYTFRQLTCYGFLNTLHVGTIALREGWYGSLVVIRNMIDLPQNWRDRKNGESKVNGGWHFSYLGGREQIAYKLSSFAHQEYDTEHCKNGMANFFYSYPTDIIVLEKGDDRLPKYLNDNWERYKGKGFIYENA
jgi:beta-1,4-mannosyl-glycoprotein beta-1,4-N-acetylglucosaminyltransferase